MKLLKNEQDFFRQIADHDLNEFVFSSEGIINDEELEDIWSLYKVDHDSDCYSSLDSLLYKISFDSQSEERLYQVEHGEFYNMLTKYKGIKHLATLMHKICVFLTKLTEMGVLYGNLRPENILIKFDKYKSRIEQVKFIDFGCVTDAENVNSMVLPVRLDHVPPEVLRHFKGNRSFSNNETSKDKIEEDERVGE